MKKHPENRRGRPLKGDAKRVRTSFTLPPEQIAWLKNEAHSLNATKSEILSQLISEAQYYKSEIPTLLHSRFQISRKVLIRFCQRHNVKKLSLYGSVLLNSFGPESDIDILVEFEQQHKPTFFTLVRMEQELSKLLGGRKIDIKTPSELSCYFRSEVVRNAEILYAA